MVIRRYTNPTAQTVRSVVAAAQPAVLDGMIGHWFATGVWSMSVLANRFGTVALSSGTTVAEHIERILQKKTRSTGGIPLPVAMRSQTGGFPGLPDAPQTLFWGPQGAITPLHCDVGHSFNAQISGRKRWIFFAPPQEELLYPAPKQYPPAYRVCALNAADPDYRAHPLARHARAIETNLLPGETIFVPDGWFHEVHLLDDAIAVGCPVPARLAE